MQENEYSKDRFKNKFAELAYGYVRQYDRISEKNLTDAEMEGLIELQRNKRIIITKPDKGNGVVIINSDDYFRKMEDIVQDTSKFKNLEVDPTIKREEILIRLVQKLKKENKISEKFYSKIRPVGSRPSRLYGLPKIHKSNCP